MPQTTLFNLWDHGTQRRPPPLSKIYIMPLGDSITMGYGQIGGWRLILDGLLTAGGYNFDFCGNTTFNSDGMTHPYHTGYGGYRIDEIESVVSGMTATPAAPDFVCLDAGTNDFFQGANASTMQTRIDSLISTVTGKWPSATVICASIGPYGDAAYRLYPTVDSTTVYNFNNYVLLKQHTCNMQTALCGLGKLLPDDIHPTNEGYTAMAGLWYGALQETI